MKPTIALVTARAARGRDEDLPPLESALRAAEADVCTVDWDDLEVDWAAFDLALLRSTWDYTQRLSEFLAWVDRAATRTKVVNPPSVVRWNTDKHYLAELARAGAPTVPSEFIEPGAEAAAAVERFLAHYAAAELVIKPAVGAGSRDAQRHARTQRDAMIAHVNRLLQARQSVVMQPYLDRVDDYGETALIFFAGRFSHAIRKGPLLRRGEGPGDALYAPEQITRRSPAADELHVAEQTLAAMPFGTLLYARVDLIRDAAGAPCVLELELTEPSLFFAHARGSADRFAAAIMKESAV